MGISHLREKDRHAWAKKVRAAIDSTKTRTEAAKKLGVTTRTLQRYASELGIERGFRNPS
jgi:hypothetical protein